jgi:murein DD-endopeptidase MepM/ murein hydrolase activator NlpD
MRKRTASRLVSFGALLGAGALLVSLSVPANLFLVESSTAMMAADAPADVQGQVLPATESIQAAAPVERGAWDVATPAELRSASMIRVDTSYTVNNDGAVRWPFPVAVPISDGYGARVSPCSGCSSQHKGTDFTPGVGSPIAAIADGVVSVKQDSAWGFGYHVMIDHVVDGQKVTSLYAHMISGSSELQVGDVVTKGDFVGEVGTTGASTGPHLHFEIRLDGVQVNPFLWLQAHTN